MGHTVPTSQQELDLAVLLATKTTRFRLAHQWSQADLAAAVGSYGVSWQQATVSRLERGLRDMSVYEALALASVMGISLDELVAP